MRACVGVCVSVHMHRCVYGKITEECNIFIIKYSKIKTRDLLQAPCQKIFNLYNFTLKTME